MRRTRGSIKRVYQHMNTTNRYQPPFTSLPIKPPPWRDRHLPPASLYCLPLTYILLLLSNTSSSLRLNHIALHPIHSRLNLRYPKSTALSRHRPHLLHKKLLLPSHTIHQPPPPLLTPSPRRIPPITYHTDHLFRLPWSHPNLATPPYYQFLRYLPYQRTYTYSILPPSPTIPTPCRGPSYSPSPPIKKSLFFGSGFRYTR